MVSDPTVEPAVAARLFGATKAEVMPVATGRSGVEYAYDPADPVRALSSHSYWVLTASPVTVAVVTVPSVVVAQLPHDGLGVVVSRHRYWKWSGWLNVVGSASQLKAIAVPPPALAVKPVGRHGPEVDVTSLKGKVPFKNPAFSARNQKVYLVPESSPVMV